MVTNYGEGGGGGVQNGRGGCEVLLLKKGGSENVLALLKGRGGGTKSVGVVCTR